jgi:NitT/TauT family transport system ATP-binding protein
MSGLLRCDGVSISYPAKGAPVHALQDVTFQVREREFLSIVGPSGCGKTTLLRAIAGLISPSNGTVEFFDRADAPRLTPLIFQENSLFPWMTVLQNAAFGLEMGKVSRAEREDRATTMLARFGLAGRENAWPHQLSRGMKQRVAIVRAFLTSSPILLMDEPFAALDCQSRMMAQRELIDFWQQHRRTVIFVTHDVEEAIFLSDRILVLSQSPGSVIAEYDVPSARPRDLLESSETMLDLKYRIFATLKLTTEAARAACAR